MTNKFRSLRQFHNNARPQQVMEDSGMDSQFDNLAQAYESTVVDMAVRRDLEYPSYMAAVGDVTGLRVLDIGCGSGFYTRRLCAAGAGSVVGADESEGMLGYARDRENREQLGVEYVVRDVTRPAVADDSVPDGSFDLVTGVYVTPYAPTVDRLRGLFTTARRALPASGGRFVTYVLNPEVATEPSYYADYDFELALADPALDGDIPDGAPMTLTITVPEQTFSITPFRWSQQTQEEAARAAGFCDLTWIQPHVNEEGLRAYGEVYWKRYLDCPHTLILDCVAGPLQHDIRDNDRDRR